MREDGLHVTVQKLGQFLNRIPSQQIDRAMDAAGRVSAEPFDIALDTVQSTTWPDRSSMARLTGGGAGLRGILDFERNVARAMMCAGFHRTQTRRSFQPHVTLDYRHPPFKRQTLAHPLMWRVDHFMLVDSLYGLAKHEVLGCLPFVARQRDMFE